MADLRLTTMQLGLSSTPSDNFTFSAVNPADGTLKLSKGVTNNIIYDILKVEQTGMISLYRPISENATALSGVNIDVAAAAVFTKTITANTTFTVSNVPAPGRVCVFILTLVNGGAFTVTWWNNVKWPSATAPSLTASGRDRIGFITTDGGANWDGIVLGKDFR